MTYSIVSYAFTRTREEHARESIKLRLVVMSHECKCKKYVHYRFRLNITRCTPQQMRFYCCNNFICKSSSMAKATLANINIKYQIALQCKIIFIKFFEKITPRQISGNLRISVSVYVYISENVANFIPVGYLSQIRCLRN